MAIQKGIGVSKKFADGTVHENGTGKFIILNRFEGEDGAPWLEFQWLSGDKEGKTETNKEINMNSSIHKYITIKKASGEPQSQLAIITMIQKETETHLKIRRLLSRWSQKFTQC